MSTITNTTSFIATVNNLSLQIGRYVPIFLFLSGISGNLLNCFIFLQRGLRLNPCVIYFLAASISNLVGLVSGMTPILLDNLGFAADLSQTVPVLCKVYMIVAFETRTITSYMLVLAAYDRYLVSSPNADRRRLSNLKRAYRYIKIICIFSVLVSLEITYCFDANMVGTPLKCYARSDACRVYNDLALVFIVMIIPWILMLFFGFDTIANIRRTRRVVPVAVVNQPPTRNRRTEHNLTLMLLVQLFVHIICEIPQAGYIFYVTYTFYRSKSFTELLVEALLFNIFTSLTVIPNSLSFFLYTLCGRVFRQTLVKLLRIIIRQLKFNN